jgi:hypothetical protein
MRALDRIGWLLAGGALAAAGMFFAAQAADRADDLRVTDHMLTTDPFGRLIVIGAVENASDRDFAPVHLSIDMLDRRGRILGSTSLSVGALESGETWRFTADAPAEGAARVRVAATSPEEIFPGWLGWCPYTVCPWR